ncbi:uncharacterized protein PV09_07153 [Verruconis gallopava]|uniref:DNA-directed RNA polymerase III subunit RPC6 n=1 Tax=Verruconis gallopava TaxID=253628 RepID=A0A0D2A4J1_9PEZI|nr:uncharacterized protein PV09_07153 [Verruconis gallopava]KIW01385.1 hypothetical protein PV09_07153 [Verruconis gallopava]
MAPAAKRKQAGVEEQSPISASKNGIKRQKTSISDPTDSIETPPPTPKPATAAKARKPTAAKNATLNGSHSAPNGVAVAGADDVSSGDYAPAVDSPAALMAERNAAREDGDVEGDSGHGGEQSKSTAKLQASTDKPAKTSGSGAQNVFPNGAEASRQGSTRDAMPSTAQLSDSQTIRPTIEQPPAMEPAKKKPDKVKSKDREKRDKLYQYCLKKKPVGEIFSLKELQQANVADDDQDLLDLCQSLVTHFLFTVMTLNRGVLYKTRSYDVAKKLAGFSDNHILIYSLIESSGRAGVWMRPLEIKSGLHTAIVRKAVRELVSAKVVQEIKSAETSKKTYISADVKPDERHIGGGFMDEGKFDEGMINILTYVVTQFLTEKSWAKQDIRISDDALEEDRPATPPKDKPRKPPLKPSKIVTGSADAAAGKPGAKGKATQDRGEIYVAPPPPRERNLYPAWTRNRQALIPQHPHYYSKYPTSIDVMLEINEKKVIKDIVLTLKDTEQLLSKMEFDGYIERIRDYDGNLNMKEPRWRACKRSWKMDLRNESSQHFGSLEPDTKGWLPGNGLSQVPCARCRVKMKCRPGGIVSPEGCVYLDDWLKF